MVLERFLSEKRAAILERWLQLILDSYSAQTSGFLKQESDRFVNPIGYTISQEIEALYEELLHGMNSDKLAASLDNIIRIRSVQDFHPSQAIAFTLLLKRAIREELAGEIGEKQVFEELLNFGSRIDKLVLLALDIYMKCREKVYEIRVNEVKAETEQLSKLLERINLMHEKPEKEQSFEDKRM